ncbi:MAG: hypothetical protein QW495_02845, partial [Candidatus Hadarchaeum sp.]
TALVNAFAHLDQVREDLTGKSLPRMADWAVWGEAIARGLGIPPFKFINAYHRLIQEATITVLEELPLGKAILWFAEKLKNTVEEAQVDLTYNNLPIAARGFWVGTAQQLMKELEILIQNNGEDLTEWKMEGFPKTAKGIGRQLRELIPNLNDQGLKIVFDRRGDGTRIIKMKVDVSYISDKSALFLPSKREWGEKEEEKKSDREGSNKKEMSLMSSSSSNTTPPSSGIYSQNPNERSTQPDQKLDDPQKHLTDKSQVGKGQKAEQAEQTPVSAILSRLKELGPGTIVSPEKLATDLNLPIETVKSVIEILAQRGHVIVRGSRAVEVVV